MREVARNCGRGIDDDANERRHGIDHPAVDLLQGKDADRAERSDDVRGEWRGCGDADLQREQREDNERSCAQRERRQLSGVGNARYVPFRYLDAAQSGGAPLV